MTVARKEAHKIEDQIMTATQSSVQLYDALDIDDCLRKPLATKPAPVSNSQLLNLSLASLFAVSGNR